MTFAIGAVVFHTPLMFRGLLSAMRSNMLNNVLPISTTLGHLKRPFRHISGQVRCARQSRVINARFGFPAIHGVLRMPELQLSALVSANSANSRRNVPTAQSETPVPPKSATVILAQETGARSPCAAPDAEPFRIAERPASIRSPPLVANAEFSPQPREVVGAHRILGTLLR